MSFVRSASRALLWLLFGGCIGCGGGEPAPLIAVQGNLAEGRKLWNAARYVEARPHFDAVMNALGVRSTRETPGTTAVTVELIEFFYEAGEFHRSIGLCDRFAGDSPEPDAWLATARLRGAMALEMLHRMEEAAQYARDAAEIRLKRSGPDSGEYAEAAGYAAFLRARRDEAPAALRDGEAAMILAERAFADDSVALARARARWGATLHWAAQPARAEEELRRALAVLRESRPHGDLCVVVALMDLATACTNQHRYDEGLQLLEEAEAAAAPGLGPDHLIVGWILNNQGNAYRCREDFGRATECLERSLEIKRKVHRTDNRDVAIALGNLGVLYDETGRYSEASRKYSRAIVIIEQEAGPDSPLLLSWLNNHANSLHASGRFEEAMERAARGLAIAEKKLEPGHPDAHLLRHTLALCRLDLGYDAYVEKLDVERLRRDLGARNPLISAMLATAYGAATRRDDRSEAARLAETAFDHSVQVFGAESQETVFPREMLAEVRLARGDASGALKEMDAARRIARGYISVVVSRLPENAQSSYFGRTERRPFMQSVSLAYSAAAAPEAVEKTAEWAINCKGVLVETLAEREVLKRGAQDPEIRDLVGRLDELATRASANASGDAGGDWMRKAFSLQTLRTERENLENQLAVKLGRDIAPKRWVTVDEIRAALPADAVLVECLRLHRPAGADRMANLGDDAAYGAWIIPPAGRGEVEFLDLGLADDLDSRLVSLGDSMAATLNERDEAAALSEWRRKMKRVERAMAPLTAKLAGYRTWVVCPDSCLWLLPWSSLPDGDGFAVEKHVVRYASVARELLVEPAPADSSAPLVIADPDYELGVTETSRVRSVERLLGAAREGDALAELLRGADFGEPRIVRGRDAKVAVVSGASSPRVLALATHGYVTGGEGALGINTNDFVHPLMRCGVVLAGANAAPTADGDDGLLSAVEVLRADFRGTDLVLLSACETGVGELSAGEGAADLRRSFHLAGAKNVVATLWSIPDEETVELSTEFMKEYIAGKPVPEALQAAQAKIIQARRERHGAAHPFYWAAFTATGRGR